MADAEISYHDAFGAPAEQGAINQNLPPPVPSPSGKAEYSYAEAVGAQPQTNILRQTLGAFSTSGALDLHQAIGNIAQAFGEGVEQTGEDIGKNLYDKDGGDLVSSLKKSGMFQSYVEDQKDFDKGFLYRTAMPAIHNLLAGTAEGATRLAAVAGNVATLPLNAIGGALGQATEELPEGPAKELAQYALNSPLLAEFHPPVRASLQELGSRVPRPVAESEASGVIGTTEGQNMGVEPLTADQHVKQAVAESEVNPIKSVESEDVEPQEKNIHTYARDLDPETFKQYDQLSDVRDSLRSQLSSLPEQSTQDAFELKSRLQETNAALRDLAPKVSDAYLSAEKFDTEAEVLPNPESGIEPIPEMKAELESREPSYVSPEVSQITSDVKRQLIDVGRPTEEAQASGEIAARMYQYFADMYGGKKGTAQDWYEREKASVVGGKERATVLAQENKGTTLEQVARGKIRLATKDANATITLMKNADASTFVHESAHHFLDMMDRFSKEENIPNQLKSDMTTIRKWSGLSDKIPETAKEKRAYTQAQEKFARGFERYLMEGVAPSKDLSLVFAKFKNWLTSIYKTVFNIPNQRGSINEDVRAFFDRVLSRTPDKTVIAPDRANPLKENISSPKLKDLFGNVQKPPQTLTEFLASKGGLKDEGGDLKAMDADKAHKDLSGRAKPFARKLMNDNGLSLDDAARLAEQAGYFPEKGGERPTIEELKAKIAEDLGGNKQYSDKDREALNNHEDALKYNAEIDKISHETGIDPTGKTKDQFWDEVASHQSEEKWVTEAHEMAADTYAEHEDFERKIREFMESRGDAWEAPKEPDPITLEEMENVRKQSQINDDTSTSAGNPTEPRSPAGIDEHGETSVRQGGSDTELSGRGDAAEVAAREADARAKLDAARADISNAPVGDTNEPRTEGKKSANEPIGSKKSDYLDKAGNIRLDLLTDSENVKAAMREAAAKNPQVFNHGVVTDAQVSEFADAMGVDAKNLNIQKLRDLSVNDDIPLAARIRSGSQMMVDSLNHSLELMNKANPTDDDVMKFLESKNQFMMIAETVSATTNEMGRAFRAYNNLMKEYNVKDIGEATELFQRMTGKTLDQIKTEMKAGSLLKTPKQIAKFTQDSMKPDFFDKLIEYRNNSLLSGPVTHTMYTVGGFLNAAIKPIQTLAGVAVQELREAIGNEVEQRIYAREALAQVHALGYGSMRGLKAAAESWKQNAELALPKEVASAPLLSILDQKGLENVKGASNLGWLPRNQAIEGKLGAAINLSNRVIGSIHSFLKMVNYQQNLASLSVREALNKGFDPSGDEYTKYISDTIDNPSSKMMDAAGDASLKEVYREKVDYNSLSGRLFNLINSNPVTKVLFPFIKMQYNIKRLAFRDNSVLGLFDKSVRADVAGLNGDVAQNMAIGKMAAGTAVAGIGISMTMQGLNNGGGPSDPKAYKTWRLTHTPYSVQVGSLVIPHKALGIWGQLLGWSGDMAEGAHEFNPDDIEKSAWKFARKAGAIFTEEGFLTQAKNTLDAAFTPEQFGTRFIQNFATQWLPFSVGASQTNRLLNDPYSRRVKSEGAANLYGIGEAMEYKYPGTSDLLHVNRDMFGRPITFESSYDQYANDPVVQKLESLQTGIGRLPDKIKGVSLTEQQYDDYSRIAGQMTYARLSKIVAMPGFDRMPPQHQMQIIEKTTSQSRLLASNVIMKMNPEIMPKAVAKKKLSIYGNQAVNEAEAPE